MASATQANPQTWLKGLGKKWAETAKQAQEQATSGRVTVPDGDYTGILRKAELIPFNQGQSFRGAFTLEVVEPAQYAGKKVPKSDGLDTEDGQLYFAITLSRLGVDVTTLKPENIPGVLDQLTKDQPTVAFSVKQNEKNPQFKNVYINSVVDAGGAASGSTETEKTQAADETEEEPQAVEPEAVQLAEGMRIIFTFKGEEYVGPVVEILEEEEKIRVTKDSDGRVCKIPYTNIISMEETAEAPAPADDEEEEE